jgi:hypothetical protein
MPDGRDAAAIFGRWPCPPTKVHANANANWDKLATADDPHSEGKAADEEEERKKHV